MMNKSRLEENPSLLYLTPMAMAVLIRKSWVDLHLLVLFLPLFFHLPFIVVDAYSHTDFRSANLSSSWRNNPSNKQGNVELYDNSTLRPILLAYNKSMSNPPFGLGFFKNLTSINSTAKSSYLVVFMLCDWESYDDWYNRQYHTLVHIFWSANRDKPVGEDATLDFTAQGDLVLKDADGSLVWSSNTSAHSVARMEITEGGNLMLLNGSNGVVWQSFDHPTDKWLPNQKIYNGQRLTARSSSANLSTGIYYLSVAKDELRAFLDSSSPKQYASSISQNMEFPSYYGVANIIHFETYVQFTFNSATSNHFPYIVLEPNGHLILYGVVRLDPSQYFYDYSFTVNMDVDLLNTYNPDIVDCSYPTVCGRNGVCTSDGQCICPSEEKYYFSSLEPNVGCAETTPLSCKGGSKSHSFVKLHNITYFDFVPMLFHTTVEKCKEACLSNCSCKAALFRYQGNISSGYCSLQSDELYSFRPSGYDDWGTNSFTFIKVQDQVMTNQKKPSYLVTVLLPCLTGGLVLVTFVARRFYRNRMLKSSDDAEEEGDEQVTEALKKFSFEELKRSTLNFQIKLGQGGFGTVFEGVLCDGTKVAVKWLDSVRQGRKEFLAEVNTIGKIDHFNIVRLIGYCVEKTNRLLVYEHLCNGSLDRWIFNLDKAQTFSWEIRQKILYGVAKGLEYLHEDCRRNIIHFDIKPQNILLDGDYNAKISDFGLAKLIDRNQSLVLTRLKGTPGYVAPELFGGSNISVKADIYSFGIVILETVCGRKNLDSCKSIPLINIVKEKAEEDQLYDLFDENCNMNEDIECHKEEATKMIKIGMWCLQTHDRRPSMSMVVKALESSTNIDLIIDNHHIDSCHTQVNLNISAPQEASILSGPR